ncbi:glucosaminidase domain-containing protein [Marinobacter sp. CA1]|nr:glucosaminidase domain-containing protein [Marinobacter sp. CA1]
MTVGVRALMLLFPLLAAAISGGLHTPQPLPDRDRATTVRAQTKLPPLPDWALNALPDFSDYRDTTEKKAAFFSFLYPRIVLANSRILMERQVLQSLRQKTSLSPAETAWLQRQSERLRVNEDQPRAQQLEKLATKLDVVPPSLVMAQAANESAWGTSRFATQGNNLFGQWCFRPGCGLVPRNRGEGRSHEVARFASPYQSVSAYIDNLNRHPSYRQLRAIRAQARESGRMADGILLATGLESYSERGTHYVEEIQAMIHFNNLAFYDRQFADTLGDRSRQRLNQLALARDAATLLPSVGGSEG